MYITCGVARSTWLWMAVISIPCSISLFITGFTSSCSSTRSPITIASLPLFWKARYEPRASAGFSCTPSSMTVRSVRAMPTRYTPPGICVPGRPIALATASHSSCARAPNEAPSSSNEKSSRKPFIDVSSDFEQGIDNEADNGRKGDDRGHRRFLAMLAEIRRRDDREEVARQEGRQRRDHRPGEPGDQVTDKADRDHHGSRGDHGHGDGIDELPLV